MEENNGSSSNSNYSRPRNKGYDRQNSSPRNYQYNNYNNSQYNSDNDEWKLFILFASLKQFKDYIYLFISIWDSLRIDGDRNIERSGEFNDEVGQMKSYIEDLFTNSVINKQELDKFSSLLDNYRDYRYNDLEAKKDIVSHALSELEKYGMGRYKNQWYNLKSNQKKRVRQMILDRMESFINISSQSHVVDEEENDLSPDNLSPDSLINLRKEIESLRKQNSKLAQENSHYQAVKGNMANTRLGDQDPNNATQLISDIKELQHLLEEFTIVQGPDYKINEKKSIEILSKNNCQVNFSEPKAKLILGGILQQCIIKQILSDIESYLKVAQNRNPDEAIEVEILNTTERLIQSFNHFNEKRPGKDDITQAVPTKIRQQIYAALGYRGFSNDNHPLIMDIAKKICKSMNVYREVVDPDILNEMDAQSIQITRKVISIFYFRLKTQEIIPTYHFFQSGDEIDTRLMQGSWREEVKKSEVVEVCYFPYIAIVDVLNQKVLTKAQVYTRPKNPAAVDDDVNGGNGVGNGGSGGNKSIFNRVVKNFMGNK